MWGNAYGYLSSVWLSKDLIKAKNSGGFPKKMMHQAILSLLHAARQKGRTLLLESEGMAVLRAMGISTPTTRFLPKDKDLSNLDLADFEGKQVVIKIASSKQSHKSDMGGVNIVPKQREAIQSSLISMRRRFASESFEGFTIQTFIPHAIDLGHEWLLGLRWMEDFGAVVIFGPGGFFTDFLTPRLKHGQGPVVLLADWLVSEKEYFERYCNLPWISLLTESFRGQEPIMSVAQLQTLFKILGEVGQSLMPEPIAEIEINPLAISQQGPVALDVLVRLGESSKQIVPERPIHKIRHLLRPRSIALVGVSRTPSHPGAILLSNIVANGFPRERIYVVKPGMETLYGCRCVPDFEALPERVDLAVLSIKAACVPELLTQGITLQKMESILLIPGGLEEKEGGETISRLVRQALSETRHSSGQGPVLNGGNCVGLRSAPGLLNAIFIPPYKMAAAIEKTEPVALMSQSGAYLVSLLDQMSKTPPRYAISLGNQTDLTVGDYLVYFKGEPAVEWLAIYLEGFRSLDGKRFLQAVRAITQQRRGILLYQAGRTQSGARALTTHTASIASDCAITKSLARQAGVVVADTLDDFFDLLQLFILLRNKRVDGLRLGAISNAGFECVAIADQLKGFTLSEFSGQTQERLASLLHRNHLDIVVDLHNPLDLTPMMGDKDFAQTVKWIMEDPKVDIGIVGCVPMTAALQTLLLSSGHPENLEIADSIVSRLIQLNSSIEKAWVVVVEGGDRYEPMRQRLLEARIPTFRRADRALRLFQVFSQARLNAKRVYGEI